MEKFYLFFFTGVRSDVPVRFLPGASLESTKPEVSGSVTAVTRIGISSVLPATAWAARGRYGKNQVVAVIDKFGGNGLARRLLILGILVINFIFYPRIVQSLHKPS